MGREKHRGGRKNGRKMEKGPGGAAAFLAIGGGDHDPGGGGGADLSPGPVSYTHLSKKTRQKSCLFLEVPPRFELGSGAFAELCLTTWLWHLIQRWSKEVFAPSNWSE